MTTRTQRRTIEFRHAFLLKGIDRVLPPGKYDVMSDEELIEGLSFPVYRRVSTIIFVPAAAQASAIEMVSVDPRDLQSAQDRLVRKVIKLLPAQIVVTPFHVADAQLAWAACKKVLLKERYILEKELFLQVLGAGGDDYAFAAADYRQQIGQSLSRSRSRFHDQVPAFCERLFHGLRHLQLAATELIIRVRLAQQSAGGEELMQRG